MRSQFRTFAGANAKGCVNLMVIKNPTTVFSTFVDFNTGQSTVSSNVAAVTVTGGLSLFTTTVNIGGALTIDVTSFDLVMYPGDVLCFAAHSTIRTDCWRVRIVE